jgi:parallel beta-helix repeat protein
VICNNGEQRDCPNQVGVCTGSKETCVGNEWSGCDYSSIAGYELLEASCDDGKDNDCDGSTDSEDTDCQLSCGDTITKDTIMTHDLAGCWGGDALIIGANDITLDCNGHFIKGTSGHNGIYLRRKKGVEIINCNVSYFTHGIHIYDSSDYNIIKDNKLDKNECGIWLQSSKYNNITNNLFVNTRDIGIITILSYNNTIWLNNFSNSKDKNAYIMGSCDDNWNLSNIGNCWDDLETNAGYPDNYEIQVLHNSGEKGNDYHPRNISNCFQYYTMQLYPGWNLMTMLGSAETKIKYDKLFYFNNSDKKLYQDSVLYPDRPYWLKTDTRQDISIVETDLGDSSLDLTPGWNAFYRNSYKKYDFDQEFQNSPWEITLYNFKDGEWLIYSTHPHSTKDFTTFKPGEVYWIYLE